MNDSNSQLTIQHKNRSINLYMSSINLQNFEIMYVYKRTTHFPEQGVLHKQGILPLSVSQLRERGVNCNKVKLCNFRTDFLNFP